MKSRWEATNCLKFWYIHRIKYFASKIENTKEIVLTWNAHVLSSKRGIDYYVVYAIKYIKERKKKQHIFVLFMYYLWHKNLGGRYTGAKWLAIWGKQLELGRW